MPLLTDFRFAFRVLSRRPGVPTLIAALFALGLGLATGLWAVIDAVVLRPLPYRDPSRIVAVVETHPQRGLMAVTAANFFDWAGAVTAFEDVAGLGGLEASVATGGDPVRIIGSKVTEGFFDVFGVPPARGRGLTASDFAGDGRAVVISDRLSHELFAIDATVVGAPLTIDGQRFDVVGVMPRDFKTTGNSEMWVPWIMSPAERSERRFHQVGVTARLRRGRSASDAEQELRAIYGRLQHDHPDTTADWTARAVPLRDLMLGDSRRSLAILSLAVGALVVVASINIAGLLAAWLPTRRREFVVRMAVGASVNRVVSQLLLETLIWASAGMAVGVAVAFAFVRLFGAVGVSPVLEFDFDPRIDVRVVCAMTLLLVAIVAAAALAPSVVAVRRSADLVPRRSPSSGVLGHRASVVVQVALSVVLLGATAQLLAAFTTLARIAGVNRTGAFGVEVSLPDARYRDDPSQRAFFDRLVAALATRPEVQDVAVATYVPPSRIYGNVRFAVEGRSTPTDAQTTLASGVSPRLFTVLGIPLVRGRLIEERDQPGVARAGVISRGLARRYWPDEDPIGHRISLVGDPEPITIVGIVDDVRQPLSTDPRAESVLYLSFRQVPFPFMTVLVVPSREQAQAFAAVRQEVKRIDSAQAVGPPRSLDAIRGEWLEQPRLRTRIVTLFGAATLLLTLVGLSARVAYSATSRTRELAIRQALGAQRRDVVRALTGEALAVIAIGSAAGIALLPAASSSLQRVLGGVPGTTAGLVLPAAALFAACAAASAYWPARRAASRVDAAQLLRSE